MAYDLKFIEPWLRQFAQEFVRNRVRDIYKRELVNTDALARSVSAKVNADASRGIFYMLVYANTYGRYQDMRRRYNKIGGEQMVEDLEAWVEQEGVAKFMKGQYSGVYKKMTKSQVLNSIAWGTIRKTGKRGTTRKRSWWNKGKTRDIENFYDVVLKLMKEEVPKQIAQSVK